MFHFIAFRSAMITVNKLVQAPFTWVQLVSPRASVHFVSTSHPPSLAVACSLNAFFSSISQRCLASRETNYFLKSEAPPKHFWLMRSNFSGEIPECHSLVWLSASFHLPLYFLNLIRKLSFVILLCVSFLLEYSLVSIRYFLSQTS